MGCAKSELEPDARSGFACPAWKTRRGRAGGHSRRERRPLRRGWRRPAEITARNWLSGLHQLRGQRAHRSRRAAPGREARRRIRIRDWPRPASRWAAQRDQPAFAARGQKVLDCRGFFGVALVGAALVARREAHLHLGVDAAGMARIGIEIVGAAAQQEQLQRLFGKALGRRARGKRPIGPVGFALAGPVGDDDARIGIAAQIAHKGRRAQVHALQRLRAVDLFEK